MNAVLRSETFLETLRVGKFDRVHPVTETAACVVNRDGVVSPDRRHFHQYAVSNKSAR
jgi:hypothetical protein